MRYHRPLPKKSNKLPLPLALLAALLSGLCFVFALAPYGIWLVALISPFVLYVLLLTQQNSRHAFLMGWIYGFGLWATGAFWLYNSIHLYGGIAQPIAILLIGIMAAIMGLFHAIMAWVFVRFFGRQPLAFASLWVLQEWLKTWLFTGFPWLFVGYAYTDLPFVVSYAPIVGVLGISFLSVLVSASVAELGRERIGYLLLSAIFVAIGVMLWLINPKWTTPNGQTMTVSLVQGNIDQAVKWDEAYRNEIITRYANLSADEWGRDLIVLPEAAIPMTQENAKSLLQETDLVAKIADTALITGIPYIEYDKTAKEGYHLYNSVMAIGAGEGVYKKQNLVPFGEYVPLSGVFDILPSLNIGGHSAGDAKQSPLSIKNHKVGVAICYEVAYPKTTRNNAKDTELLLTVSNDAWFGTSNGPHQHLQMVRMRSLETGKWFIRSTNNGITAIIDDKGKITQSIAQFEQGVLRGEVMMRVGTTPFVRFGSYPIVLLTLVLAMMSIWAGRRGRYFAKDGKFYQDYR